MKQSNCVDWAEVERLCLRSFTGHDLSAKELQVLIRANAAYPSEYRRRTEAVREAERARIRGM